MIWKLASPLILAALMSAQSYIVPGRPRPAADGCPAGSKAKITFWWRMEGTTLDGTHDHSAGDTTANLSGDWAINTAAVKLGTNGLDGHDTGDNRGDSVDFAISTFDIVDPNEGRLSFWFRWTSGQWKQSVRWGMLNNNDDLSMESASADGKCIIIVGASGVGDEYPDATGVDCAPVAGTWYHIQYAWDTNDGAGSEYFEIWRDGVSLYSASNLTISIGTSDGLFFRNGSSVAAGEDMHYDHLIITDDKTVDHYTCWSDTDSYDDAEG